MIKFCPLYTNGFEYTSSWGHFPLVQIRLKLFVTFQPALYEYILYCHAFTLKFHYSFHVFYPLLLVGKVSTS